MAKTVLGMIGGSGVYDIPGLENPRWERVEDALGRAVGRIAVRPRTRASTGVPAAPWPRPYPDSDLDQLPRQYRRAEARRRHRYHLGFGLRLLREELPPGTFVIVDQFIDRTFAREKSFFGPGFVAHVPMAHPVCPRLADALDAPAATEESRSPKAAPISRWKARNSPPSPKASSIAPGDARSSA